MSKIRFSGGITSGVGKYVELHVPGRDEIPQAPPDWPVTLEKGSLNVRINPDGYPPLFATLGLLNTVKSLDMRPFQPTFEIWRQEFGNNQLGPAPTMPHRGSAQVWRAVLSSNGHDHSCWVLRRYGSGVGEQLELLSHLHMRTAFRLVNGQPVVVTLEQGNAQQSVQGDGPRSARSAA